MFHVVLFEPRIPPNTGNAIRLCANSGSRLHLIEPLGFDLTDANLRRAGLDYHDLAVLQVHPNLAAARAVLPYRWFATTAAGSTRYDQVAYQADDVFLFGPEPTGLPPDVLADFDVTLAVPMLPGNRSINLSNTVSIVVFEAWRQTGFPGAAPRDDGATA